MFKTNHKYLISQQISLSMDKKSDKTYFIELLEADKLLNKFKFVLSASKIADLKTLIKEKLESKGALKKEDKIVLKDLDDYELASDDQVDQVVADGKLRVHLDVPKGVNIVPQVQPQHTVVQQPNLSQQNITSVTSLTSNNSQSASIKKFVVESANIDSSQMRLPSVASDHPKQMIMQARIPQIRKSAFSIAIKPYGTFLQFSNDIIKQFNFPPNYKALLFDNKGQPLLFNLDLMGQAFPKLSLNQDFTIILTTTNSTVDNFPQLGMHIQQKQVLIQVNLNSTQIKLQIDLNNTLSVLKFRIFEKIGIHPTNQIIKFGNNPLLNDLEPLHAYNLQEGCIVELHFKNMSNLVPSTQSDRFYYKDIQHINTQTQESLRILRSNLLVIGEHLSEQDRLKLVCFIRQHSGNFPLALALKCMFNKIFMSQAHRIALQQGLYVAICDFLKGCDPLPKQIQTENVFYFLRNYIGYCLQSISKTKGDDQQLKIREAFIKIDPTCFFNVMKPIVDPVQIQLDNKQIVIDDKSLMEQQVLKGFTYQKWKAPKKESLKTTSRTMDAFQILKSNSIDNKQIALCLWIGVQANPFVIQPAPKGSVQKYNDKIDNYPEMKVHKALEIKNKGTDYLLFTSKENQHLIFLNKNKDINKPHNIFDVISGEYKSVNLDLMMGAGKTENLEELVDLKDIKPVITRQPKQAIAILMDISGSMGGNFFNQKDLNRMGAVKSFFQAFAYRTIAYNFQHVVQLILFDSQIEIQCDFTEAIYDFNRFVANAKPRGSTRLYDCITVAVQQLKKFKLRYPECHLRILALTDGQDNGSSATVLSSAKAVVEAGIIMDSFAVGTECTGLKNITLATGGKCYLTRNLEESLKLFEQQTVLSIRAREIELQSEKIPIQLLIQKANCKAFDMPDSVHNFKMPEIKKPGTSAKDMAKMLESEQQQKKISGSGALKRIAKQIQAYEKNPHPFVSIYPCQNINIWKILLLGPKQTPYQNGLFLLYAQFPGDYPFKAPEIRFITPIYHCNMNQQGRICHSVFDRNYSPALSFRQIIDCVYGLILTPEPQDPLDNVIASYYLSEYQTYIKNATAATKEKASKSIPELVQELFGKISDDIEKQKKIEQIGKWVDLAKSFN